MIRATLNGLLFLVGCDGSVDADAQHFTEAAEIGEVCAASPLALSVESRNYELFVRQEPGGRRWYTVRDKAGRVVAPCISNSVLRERYPEAAESKDVVDRALRTPQFGYVE